MTQARSKMLTQAALYAHNHTEIDPHDIVAFYAGMATPADFPNGVWDKSPVSITDAFDKVCSDVILDIKSKDPEGFEGAYNAALQAAFDDDRRGCGTSYLSGYIADMRSVLSL